jgi:hypothetical protein
MRMPRFPRTGLILAMLFSAAPAQGQQDEPLVLDPDVSFDPSVDFGFDDDIFAGAFDEEEQSATEAWFEDFTIRISQSTSGQINNHSIDLGAFGKFPKQADLETNRLQFNVRYQNPIAPGWLIQGSMWYRVYWNQDYEYTTNQDSIDTEGQLNDLFIQRSSGAHSLKLGRQTVVWGETVGNSVLDIINNSEFRDFTIIDIEDARLSQAMLVWDFFGTDNSSSLSTFVNLYPEFNPAPVRVSPLFFDPGFNLPDYSREGKILLEAGTQWKKSFEGSDIALMAAYLYENQLRYDPPLPGSADARPDINDFLLLGFSANRAIGKLLLNFDLAFSHNILADSFAFPGTSSLSTPVNLRKDQIGTSFGFEYAIDNEQNVSLGIQAQTLLDAEEGLQPGQTLTNDGVFGSWLVRYSNAMRNGDLTLSATLQGDLAAESLLVFLGVDYTLDDNWSLSSQIISITAQSGSFLTVFDEDIRLGTTLTYSF